MAAAASACAPGLGPSVTLTLTTAPQTAHVSYDQAIQSARSGELIGTMNSVNTHARYEGRAQFRHDEGAASLGAYDEFDDLMGTQSAGRSSDASAAPIADLCPAAELTVSPDQATTLHWQHSLVALRACMDKALEPARLARKARSYFVKYRRSVTDRTLSRMEDDELRAFLRAEFVAPWLLVGLSDEMAPHRLQLRNRFEDRDLDELRRLMARIEERLKTAEAYFFALVDKYRMTYDHYAPISNRYELLLLIRDGAAKGVSKEELAFNIVRLFKRLKMDTPPDVAQFPTAMLRPWAILAIAPDKGKEDAPLSNQDENPFLVVVSAVAQLAGTPEIKQRQIDTYMRARAVENMDRPQGIQPDAQAARVAMLDTGVDFITWNALGRYLSNVDKAGEISSFDFADWDSNPFLPSTGVLGHGSGTMASLVTVLSHHAYDVLENRKLNLVMWKAATIRSLLGSPYLRLGDWENRLAIPEAIISQATRTDIADDRKPQLVSISATFSMQPYLQFSKHQDALLRAPWLWVLSAGNDSVSTEHPSASNVCLGDVPGEYRPDERIVCVGAVVPGIDRKDDMIASYSNYGDRVDFYAYESYANMCPDGTSCSTPAVSAVAAAIFARYPNLTPALVKQVLVATAEDRELLTAAPGTLSPMAMLAGLVGEMPASDPIGKMLSAAARVATTGGAAKSYKFLDPSTMMGKALSIAAIKSAELATAQGGLEAL